MLFFGLAKLLAFKPLMDGQARGAVEYLAPGIIVFFFSEKIVRLAYRDEHGQRSEDS